MLTEENKEILQRIAHELMLAGQKAETSLTEEQLTDLMDKALAALQPAEAEQLLLLGSQAANTVAQLRRPEVTEVRPQVLECDVVRFQNNKEKWVAFVGLLDGYPYEIFTGLQDDEEGIVLPKTVTKGKILKQRLQDHRGGPLGEVQQGILELCEAHLRRAALPYAAGACHQTRGFAVAQG